jgi:hypothetical protein
MPRSVSYRTVEFDIPWLRCDRPSLIGPIPGNLAAIDECSFDELACDVDFELGAVTPIICPLLKQQHVAVFIGAPRGREGSVKGKHPSPRHPCALSALEAPHRGSQRIPRMH